jgi:hypothetical protein
MTATNQNCMNEEIKTDYIREVTATVCYLKAQRLKYTEL